MTELKYLEEVFPAYRAGRKLGYYSIYHPKDIVLHIYNSPEYRLEWFLKNNPEAIMDKGWCIIPDLVSWPDAWEALKAGKRIKDPITGHVYRSDKINNKILLVAYSGDLPEYVWSNIPIEWLDRNDFEVLDV